MDEPSGSGSPERGDGGFRLEPAPGTPTATAWRGPAPKTFSLGRRLGLVFVLVVALLAGVCTVVVLNLDGIRLDASRLLEETNEASSSEQLAVELESITAQLDVLRALPRHELDGAAEVEARIAGILEVLSHLHGPAESDPSRVEHQDAENRLIATIGADLAVVEQALAAGAAGLGDPRLARALARSSRYADVLAEETRREARRSNADLQQRARRSSRVMVGTVIGAAVALCFVLWLVARTVVAPIRTLQERAERFGRGELEVRSRIRSRDEIGALSRSFDDMAERIAATHGKLEERVATRTRELMRAARYADIGVLAAGVAHEINNPLGSIASCAEGLERRLLAGDVARDEQLGYLRTIASEAWRARDITGRLLMLSRQERTAGEAVEIASLLRQVELMVRHQLERSGVDLVIDVADPPPVVRGDAGELLQVLVNLVLNARDAAPRGTAVRLSAARLGDAVEMAVEDAGPGVPPELADRIFDPFFTTKAPGEGTGLGLALVASIVEAHGGSVGLARSAAGGARFTVRLPAWSEVRA